MIFWGDEIGKTRSSEAFNLGAIYAPGGYRDTTARGSQRGSVYPSDHKLHILLSSVGDRLEGKEVKNG